MQLFSSRHWLPLKYTIYADRKLNFSQLDLKDRILSAVTLLTWKNDWVLYLVNEVADCSRFCLAKW